MTTFNLFKMVKKINPTLIYCISHNRPKNAYSTSCRGS